MFQDHYAPLVIAYLVALAGWLVANRLMSQVWPRQPIGGLARPWREFGIALVGAAGILVMGQLWTRGIRLPEPGAAGPILGAINQVLIFAPIVLMVVVRRQPWVTAWLPRGCVGVRLLVGLGLGVVAVTAYSLLRAGSDAPWLLVSRIWRYEHLDEMTQVFLEDVTKAILFVRLAGAVGGRWGTVVVACLFAAGHVPAMVSQGAT